MTVFLNLAALVPLSVLAWFLVLPVNGAARSRWVLWPLAAIVIVPLGAYLGAAVGIAFGEPLQLAPFSWVDQPFFAARVIVVCAVVGGGFSFGVATLVAKSLQRMGWTNLPRLLVSARNEFPASQRGT